MKLEHYGALRLELIWATPEPAKVLKLACDHTMQMGPTHDLPANSSLIR